MASTALAQATLPAPGAASDTIATPAAIVPTPEEAARAALDQLERRERELETQRDAHSMVGAGLAVGLGIPAAITTLTLGTAFLSNASGEPNPSYQAHDRRIGRTLIGTGLVAVGATVWGAIRIHQARTKRRLAQYELRAIAVQRVIVESGLPGAALPLLPSALEADEATSVRRPRSRLTSRGRVMLTGGFDLDVYARSGDSERQWQLGLSPGFAYFLRDGLALGAYVTASRGETQFSPSANRLDVSSGGGVRMIYEAMLGPNVGLWIWPYLAYVWQRSTFSAVEYCFSDRSGYVAPGCTVHTDVAKEKEQLLQLGLLLPLMFHLTPNWGVGAGPRASFGYALVGHNSASLGLASTLVGSF